MNDRQLEALLTKHYEGLAPRPEKVGASLAAGAAVGAAMMVLLASVACVPVSAPRVRPIQEQPVQRMAEFGDGVPTLGSFWGVRNS